MSEKYDGSIHRTIRRIDDAISEIKDRKIELELGRLKKEIPSEPYHTEIKQIQQKEDNLISEKEEVLAKFNASHALEHREGNSHNSRDQPIIEAKDSSEEKNFMRYIRVCECKDKNEQTMFCSMCKSFDCTSNLETRAYNGTYFDDEELYRVHVCPECDGHWDQWIQYHCFYGYPDSWRGMNWNETSHAVALCKGTSEYDRILGRFKETFSLKVNILEVRQVQNKILFQQYSARHSYDNSEERKLWQGTSTNCVDHINMYGFDSHYAEQHVSNNKLILLVSADEAFKSAGPLQQMAIYLCDVLIGKYTKETPSSKIWPKKTKSGSRGWKYYDSVVDNVENPTRFVVYSESQVYPAYYIVVQRKN